MCFIKVVSHRQSLTAIRESVQRGRLAFRMATLRSDKRGEEVQGQITIGCIWSE